MQITCPRHGSKEDFEHAASYPGIANLKNEHLNDMKTKLMKVARKEQDEDAISAIIADVKNYIN